VNLPGVEEENFANNNNSLLHGTQVLKRVVSPWFGSNRIVCADSYFASVGAAKELFCNGLRFIGVVKTATRGFPKTFLTSVELHSRGDVALKANAAADSPEYGAMVWMDRERRYFFRRQVRSNRERHINDVDGGKLTRQQMQHQSKWCLQ
jgi:hypothetical protein